MEKDRERNIKAAKQQQMLPYIHIYLRNDRAIRSRKPHQKEKDNKKYEQFNNNNKKSHTLSHTNKHFS